VAHAARHDNVLGANRRCPGTIHAIQGQRIQSAEGTAADELVRYDFVLEKSNAASDHAHGNEIILRIRRLWKLHHVEYFAGCLVKGFDRGQNIPIVQHLGFRQQAFRSVLIDIEAKDLSAKLAVNQNTGWSSGKIGVEFVRLSEGRGTAKNQQSQTEKE
jgi:hypothetical protein